jgi:hypothetical protein
VASRFIIAVCLLMAAATVAPASADDTLKLAVGGRSNWDSLKSPVR